MTQAIARVFGARVPARRARRASRRLRWSMEAGLLLGLFPVNVLHNLVHLSFGAWGLHRGRDPRPRHRVLPDRRGSRTSCWPWSDS